MVVGAFSAIAPFVAGLAVKPGKLWVLRTHYLKVVIVNYLRMRFAHDSIYEHKRFALVAHVRKWPMVHTVMQFTKNIIFAHLGLA